MSLVLAAAPASTHGFVPVLNRKVGQSGVSPPRTALCRRTRPRAWALQMVVEKDGRGSVRAAAAEDDLYFATKVSDRGDAKLFFSLVRNQLILAFSCAWTLSVIDPQSDPTFFAQTSFDISTIPLALGVLFSAPLVAGGLAISRSESRTWVEINAATNQLALRLFGRNRALAAVAVSSSLLGIITGAAEELRYSRTALNERACLAPTSPGRATCTACIGLIRKQAALHGCSDWMRWPTASEGSAYRSLPTALV